jgi:hypothetical protein
MVVFLPQLTMINIEIPAHFPSGSARTRSFAARANILLDTHEARVSGDRRVPALVA